MPTPNLDSFSVTPIEERFLAALQQRPFPVAELLGMLVTLDEESKAHQREGKPPVTTRRDDCALVLQETFADNGEVEGLSKFFAMKAEWMGNIPGAGHEMREVLASATKDRMLLAMIDSVGLGTIPPKEAIRRLDVLLGCAVGTRCLDKTWGFGVVQRLDDFHRKVTVDFVKHTGHGMTFAYAGEVLRLVGPQHILAVHFADPAAFEKMMRENPAEAARMMLRSMGEMAVGRMEEEFAKGGLMPEGMDWKGFWTAARTALKKDPMVKVPPVNRKNDTVQLLERAVSLGNDAWFDELSALRDVPAIIVRLHEIHGKHIAPEVAEQAQAVIKERLEFVIKASDTIDDYATEARALLLVKDFAADIDISERLRDFGRFFKKRHASHHASESLENRLDIRATDPEKYTVENRLMTASEKLSPRDLERLLALLPFEADANLSECFVEVIPRMNSLLLGILLPKLLQGNARQETQDALRFEFTSGRVALPLLLWLTTHHGDPEVAPVITPVMLATQCLTALDAEETGESLRLQHQIARRFEDEAWLTALVAQLDDVSRTALFERVRFMDGSWEPAKQRAIIAHLIHLYPELSERRVVTAHAEAVAAKPRLTSWRSYNARMEQRRKLIEEELPANAHDINTARGYGDLRENFEYQTAKDRQRELLKKNADLDADIKAVKGTDFALVATDKAGMGTTVVVTIADKPLTFHILGEWDSDEALHIISCRSRVAQSLDGKLPGDSVTLPYDSGEATGTVTSVAALPTPIIDWVMSRDLHQ